MPNIQSHEIFVHEGGARIRTRAAKKDLSDSDVAWAAQYSKLDVDDVVSVSCMNHERDTVLWRRTYLVASRRDFLRRSENERGDVKQEEAMECRVLPLTDWLEVTQIEPVKAEATKAA